MNGYGLYDIQRFALFSLAIGTILLSGCGSAPKTQTPATGPHNSAVQRATPKPLNQAQSLAHRDLIKSVRTVVARLERQKIQYGVKKLSDCSGVFHRVLLGLKKRHPSEPLPKASQYRTTRQLGQWYQKKNRLTLVTSATKASHVIQPGMVLFYGQTNGSIPKPADLFKRGIGINHLGVVVDVQYDKAGNLTAYSLFHGRRPNTVASTTRYHKRTSKPPFGNGREQWIAYAPIFPSVPLKPAPH